MAGHWSGRARRSTRCGGEGCTICASGDQVRIFTYVMVELEDETIRVWEIPERMYDLARELEASAHEGVGCQLAIRREGTAANSRLWASIVGESLVEELEIGPFVDTLGLPSPTLDSGTGARSASHEARDHVRG